MNRHDFDEHDFDEHARHAVCIAPHWGHPGHLGGRRVERFRRWLETAGWRITIVRGGSADRHQDHSWGREIVIRDPLGFYRDDPESGPAPLVPRPPNRIRKCLAHLLLVPEPTIVWSRRARAAVDDDPGCRRCDLVLASSPPESSLLAAERLARRWNVALAVDMRDGWLDEPMLPLVSRSRLQRARHRRLEARVVGRARVLFVTSPIWRQLLITRYPDLASRVEVLTNVVEPVTGLSDPSSGRDGSGTELVYPGRIASSRPERRTADLMQLALMVATLRGGPGRFVLLGERSADEREEILSWSPDFQRHGWRLRVDPPVPESALADRLAVAHGLLVLSASRASLPAKLFDCLATGRPVLAAAPEDSAVALVAARIPRLHLEPLGPHDSGPGGVRAFCRSLTEPSHSWVPEEFTEPSLAKVFVDRLAEAVSKR